MNKKSYKNLLFIFFIFTFMFLNVDVMAAHECEYTFTDKKGRKGEIFAYVRDSQVIDSSKVQSGITIENIAFSGSPYNLQVLEEKRFRNSGVFIVENDKLYCPSKVTFCYNPGKWNFFDPDWEPHDLSLRIDDKACGWGDQEEALMTLVGVSGVAREYEPNIREVTPTYNTTPPTTYTYIDPCKAKGANFLNDIKQKSLPTYEKDFNTIKNNPSSVDYYSLIAISKGINSLLEDAVKYCNYYDTDSKTEWEEVIEQLSSYNEELNDTKDNYNLSEEQMVNLEESYNKNSEAANNAKGILADIKVPFSDNEITCGDLIDDDLKLLIQTALKILRIGAPIILLVMVTIDFSKAVIANDDKVMKKAVGDAVKRVIAAIALFFVPLLVSVMINWIDESEYFNKNNVNCSEIFEESGDE